MSIKMILAVSARSLLVVACRSASKMFDSSTSGCSLYKTFALIAHCRAVVQETPHESKLWQL